MSISLKNALIALPQGATEDEACDNRESDEGKWIELFGDRRSGLDRKALALKARLFKNIEKGRKHIVDIRRKF